jgi:hypothetical protein
VKAYGISIVAIVALALAASSWGIARADVIPFSTAQSSQYPLIGLRASSDFELPSTSSGGYDFPSLLVELGDAAAIIPTLERTALIDLSQAGGQLKKELDDKVAVTGSVGFTDIANANHGDTILRLADGLNVIDIYTGGSDFKLDNSNLIIDGSAAAFAIFRFVDDRNFLISNGDVLVGTGGIGLNNVMFFNDARTDGQHFNFSNSTLNGVAFWTLGAGMGEININNAQGCAQLVGDKIDLNNVNLNGCSFGTTQLPGTTQVPEPPTLALMALLLLGLGSFALRRARS